MNFLRLHRWLWLALVMLSLLAPLSAFLLQAGWNRTFYAVHLAGSLSLLYLTFYVGEALRQIGLKRGWIRPFYAGWDWVASILLGVAVWGHLAIAGGLLTIAQPWIYQLVFLLAILWSSFKVNPCNFTRPFRHVWQASQNMGQARWLWLLPLLLLAIRALTTSLPQNGTEQLHNTLPYASMIFRGVNFYEHAQDNHFLLLGLYESTGVFWLAWAGNDFSYHILSQQLTFWLTIGGFTVLLGSIPWLLRAWPAAACVMAAWPAMLNFAPTDTLAFKPDWIAVLAAFLATLALMRQWTHRHSSRHQKTDPYMWSIIIFSAIAVCNKLTAVNYVIFLLPTSVLLSVWNQGKIQPRHWLTPFVFLLGCLMFFGKNALWLGNPLYPGFQTVFAKPERLAQTATFNQFKINKVTKKIPDALDYIRGYTRFIELRHHPEFLLTLALCMFLVWRGWMRKESLFLLGFFAIYISLILIMFYPDIYQRYVAFAYILWLWLAVLSWRALLHPSFSTRFRQLILGGFLLLMLSHAHADTNFQQSRVWWWSGISPQDYRIQEDPLTKFYFEINESCPNPGTLLNRKWRSFLYAHFNTINLTDLPGEPYTSGEYYNRHNVNFVITPTEGYIAEEIRTVAGGQSWFVKNFSVVSTSGDTLLWKRNQFQGCNRWN